MIEDEEFRRLFKTESEEHLEGLERGLLELEKNPRNQPVLEEIFREVHSLKGSSRMLGLREIEAISHQLESFFAGLKRGQATLSPSKIDPIFRAVQGIRQLVSEAVTGTPANVDVNKILEVLTGEVEESEDLADTDREPEIEGPPPESDDPSLSMAKEEPWPDPQKSEAGSPPLSPVFPNATQPAVPGAGPQAITEKFRLETIRVETRKLDALLNYSGELSVTKGNIVHRSTELEEVFLLFEEWTREGTELRALLNEIGQKLSPGEGDRLSIAFQRQREQGERLGSVLQRLKKEGGEDNARLEFFIEELKETVRTMRLLPLSTVFNLFPGMVHTLRLERSKRVDLIVEGEEVTVDKGILEAMKDPLMHLIRNAVDHGIETPEERTRRGKPPTGVIRLRAIQSGGNIVIEVSDDGSGLDLERIRISAIKKKLVREEDLSDFSWEKAQSLIFMPGFSTSSFVTDVSGRGIGLDVVRTNVERIKGNIQIESKPGRGCTFRIQFPMTVATSRVVTVEVDGRIYALADDFVDRTVRISLKGSFTLGGRRVILVDETPVPVVWLRDLLELQPKSGQRPRRGESPDTFPGVVILDGLERLALLVDDVLDEQEIVLQHYGGLLKRVRNVSGTAILETGKICIVLNPSDLIKSAKKKAGSPVREQAVELEIRKKVILLVEDNITTRIQEKRILDGAGFEVITAVDGADALTKLGSYPVDAVVSDIVMPNMDGLLLTEKIRGDKKYRELPIVLVTSLSSEVDKKKGMEAGANAYIPKPGFDQTVLLDTLNRLV